jgi:hypothetical protein
VWNLDSLVKIGGFPVTVLGAPRVVPTPLGNALEFNGSTDGLFVEANPIEGLRQFTIEAVIEPAADGPEEQRFLHLQERDSQDRALLELRLSPDKTWCLDTFLKRGAAGLPLIDRAARHPAGSWHAVAITYDGTTMAHYVNGARELSGEVVFGPLKAGRVSIGVRQNKVSWFKGRIRTLRFSPEALPPARLLTIARNPEP